MTNIITNYINSQTENRREILQTIHALIIENDSTISPIVAPMMGKEMILYNCDGSMKYGLSSLKNYMSLHAMPIYGSKTIYEKYKALLPKAKFQKSMHKF